MASSVSEKRAREVAEAARESEWKLPSFGKELSDNDDAHHAAAEPVLAGEHQLAAA